MTKSEGKLIETITIVDGSIPPCVIRILMRPARYFASETTKSKTYEKS